MPGHSVIASEAKQSSVFIKELDCRGAARLAMTSEEIVHGH